MGKDFFKGVNMPPRYFKNYEEASEYNREQQWEEKEETEEERQQEEDEYWEKIDQMIDELKMGENK
jgi:hypothetical protein